MSLWKALQVSPKELRIDLVLNCGQAFRWVKVGDLEWGCVLNITRNEPRLIILKQTEDDVLFRVENSIAEIDRNQDTSKAREMLHDYFQLGHSYEDLYSEWSKDGNFKEKALNFTGIRVLRQDPIENVFTFICSSNNNIARISKMVENMCIHFGKYIASVGDVKFFSFPSPENLASEGVEEQLRLLGFGYRAKYIVQSAKFIAEKDAEWLYELRKQEYSIIRQELLQLSGVGPKVADCISLMSMDCPDALPVDTHVWQIAIRDYGFKSKQKSLTAVTYKQIGDIFREKFGPFAGWAHTVLFAADLTRFQDRIDLKRKREE